MTKLGSMLISALIVTAFSVTAASALPCAAGIMDSCDGGAMTYIESAQVAWIWMVNGG